MLGNNLDAHTPVSNADRGLHVCGLSLSLITPLIALGHNVGGLPVVGALFDVVTHHAVNQKHSTAMRVNTDNINRDNENQALNQVDVVGHSKAHVWCLTGNRVSPHQID